MLRSMSSLSAGWWRRGCFSSNGAGLTGRHRYRKYMWLMFSWKCVQVWGDFTLIAGCHTHLSKTSRLSASFVLVGVLRVFCRISTFFFKLCGETCIQQWQPCGDLCVWFEQSKHFFCHLPYRDFFVSIGQVVLKRLYVIFGLIHLHSSFV